MANHIPKKYIAKVEKTVYTVETIEFIAETEKEAEEMLDNYCASIDRGDAEEIEAVEVTESEIQEEEVNDSWIEESRSIYTSTYFEE
jgi:LPS O-antigen subunit length determinant protein (WzzB/FepE family)